MADLGTTTPAGFLLVLAVLLPVVGIILSFVTGGRHADRITLALTPFGSALACAIAFRVGQSGRSVIYTIGGWPPPLGVALQADGISAVMLVATPLS
jgi:multicomponent Na+:H+ antiporter subunit D